MMAKSVTAFYRNPSQSHSVSPAIWDWHCTY